MYPEFSLWSTLYSFDSLTPLVGLFLFIVVLYGITKIYQLRFRDIIAKIPLIVIMTLLFGTYVNFVFQSGHVLPTTWAQLSSLLSISVSTLDFIWIVLGCFIASMITLSQMSPKTKTQWWYILFLTYLCVLLVLWVMYTFGDSVIGKFNEWFFSIGSFVQQSRIGQLWGSVYPIWLLISAWSAVVIGAMRYMFRRRPRRAWYRWCALFMIWYVIILHYQHYPRHLIVNLWSFQMDLRSYLCIAIACITWYFAYSVVPVHRFVPTIHEDTVWETR